MQTNSPRAHNMRELRRAAANSGGREAVESVRPAADIDRDAKASSAKLKDALKKTPPWAREVEVHRQRCRELFLSLLFGHPLSTHAQSLEPLWHHTTYSLISAYRAVTANLESQLPPPSATRNNNGGNRRRNGNANNSNSRDSNRPEAIELKKVLTRFRQVLVSEDLFYRGLITRLVGFYQLQQLAGGYLSAVSIGVPEEVVNGGAEHGLAPRMSFEEKKDKIGLVYKALICLGDLERYRVQYDENTRRHSREGRLDVSANSEKYGKAWTYYEVARSLVPDDGSAFNQLAVISTYSQDDFLCVYYYFRALAVKNAFKNIEEILDKYLKKIYEKWVGKLQRRRDGGEDEQEEDGDEDKEDGVRSNLLLLVAILYRRSGLSTTEKLEGLFLSSLQAQLSARQLPSETIVKATAVIIGIHWQARQSAFLTPSRPEDPRSAQRRLETEMIALRLLLNTYTQLLSVGAGQVEEALQARRDESAVDTENEVEPKLHTHLSAVLRRILPALRILSKWLKLHLEYITRIQRSGVLAQPIGEFWNNYSRLVIALATLFPIDHLPSLVQPLEEDIDMRGFIPLARGMAKGTGDDEQHDSHPNEEQLMRIADLQVDAKLLAQTSSGQNAMSPPTSHIPLPTAYGRRDGQDDLASVSTETEDDPVNMAMRATLAGSSTDEDEPRDDGEEVIVWNARPQHSTPIAAPSTFDHVAPTAQDLLQNLMIDHHRPPSTHHTPQVAPSMPRQPSTHTGQHSPGMLFGGDATGSSIWTMTREESGRGRERAPAAPNVNIANIWHQDQTPSPPARPGLPSSGSGQGHAWHRPSPSGGPSGMGSSHVWGADARGVPPFGNVGGPNGAGVGVHGGQRGSGPWASPAVGSAMYPR